MPRLEPFAPGQVFDASRHTQIHVLAQGSVQQQQQSQLTSMASSAKLAAGASVARGAGAGANVAAAAALQTLSSRALLGGGGPNSLP